MYNCSLNLEILMSSQLAIQPTETTYKFVGTPLEKIPQLKSVLRPLSALGYVTLEQLVYGAQVAGNELSQLLRVDLDELIASVPAGIMTIPAADLDNIITADYSLGFAIETLGPPPPAAPDFSLPPEGGLNPAINLIPQMPPIRDQQNRGTCVAHASVAALEHHLGRAGAYQDMSEQFCYWNCKQNDGNPNTGGTWLRIAIPLLQRDGCCKEATWPYNPAPNPGNEGQGPPPGGAQAQALQYRPRVTRLLAPTAVPDIKSELGQGRVVVFSIPVYNSWYRNNWVAYAGDLIMPVPHEVRVGGHAMCLVGYIDIPEKSEWGGGRFLLRNSWGERWGVNSPYGKGYGTIPYSYIARFCMEAYSIP